MWRPVRTRCCLPVGLTKLPRNVALRHSADPLLAEEIRPTKENKQSGLCRSENKVSPTIRDRVCSLFPVSLTSAVRVNARPSTFPSAFYRCPNLLSACVLHSPKTASLLRSCGRLYCPEGGRGGFGVLSSLCGIQVFEPSRTPSHSNSTGSVPIGCGDVGTPSVAPNRSVRVAAASC